jgi:transposase-like protein
MTRKQNDVKGRIEKEELNQLLAEDRDLLNIIVEQTVQPVFKAKMEEALPGGKSERTERRLSYRAGCYSRTLIMPYQLIWMC